MVDVAMVVTGKSARNAARDVGFVEERRPEVYQKLSHFRFPGQGQRETPVTCATGIIELVLLLPGRMASRLRRQAAELLARYLGGDLKIVDEVCAVHGFQQHLAAERPDDPRRIFAEAVEAGDAASSGASFSAGPLQDQLARAFSD